MRADFMESAVTWMDIHVLVRRRTSPETPSGPGADLVLVFLKASSICCLVGRCLRGPLYPFCSILVLSCWMSAAIKLGCTAVPPSMLAKWETHASARASASGYRIPCSFWTAGTVREKALTLRPGVPVRSGLSAFQNSLRERDTLCTKWKSIVIVPVSN